MFIILFQCGCDNTSCPFCNIMTSIRYEGHFENDFLVVKTIFRKLFSRCPNDFLDVQTIFRK